ncbi:SAVED domain-containing protein [Kribbella sp. NBC_00482]|uniref:SAVED domain-containing protein n=1 Tax=Kribbella sp. NBC_00482 TaxID=2975968 RepID=UPI002E19495A
MTLPARAAALRGDDYQHAIGWRWVCEALDDPDVESVSIEDREGGAFDDVVVRRRTKPTIYWQVKSSNYGDTIVNEDWLFTKKTAKGSSPLQHFYATWRTLRSAAGSFELALVANRGFDASHPILGAARSLYDGRLQIDSIRLAGSRSKLGKARVRWAKHLEIDADELLAFLGDLQLLPEGNELSVDKLAQAMMRTVGLRADQDAVVIGKAMVREWVKQGLGQQTRDDLRRQVAGNGLLARAGTVVFAVHAIDRTPGRVQPTVELDIVDLYDGDEPFLRRQLREPGDWSDRVLPLLHEKVRELEAYGPRRVEVTGAMRLPMLFAVGRALPDVRGWVLSWDQHGEEWTTADPSTVTPRVLSDRQLGEGPDLAVAIALTSDPSTSIEIWARSSSPAPGRLLVLGPDHDPSHTVVPGGDWSAGWARAAREAIRQAATNSKARRVHLFLATPAGTALMLGHYWNMMPTTVLYEYIPSENTYIQTMTLG